MHRQRFVRRRPLLLVAASTPPVRAAWGQTRTRGTRQRRATDKTAELTPPSLRPGVQTCRKTLRRECLRPADLTNSGCWGPLPLYPPCSFTSPYTITPSTMWGSSNSYTLDPGRQGWVGRLRLTSSSSALSARHSSAITAHHSWSA